MRFQTQTKRLSSGLFQGALDECQAALGLFTHQVFAVAANFWML